MDRRRKILKSEREPERTWINKGRHKESSGKNKTNTEL
jgi:hypothetical protein